MPYNIQTGQLDLGELKEYLLRPEPTSLSGSALNTTGFYPYADAAILKGELKADIDIVSGDTRQVSGDVRTLSGIIDTNISNLDASLKSHVRSDYLTKKDVSPLEEVISGRTHFEKSPHFNKGIYLDTVESHANFSTIQTGVGSYTIVSTTEYGDPLQSYEVMTNYMRFPSRGDGVRQDVVVSSLMYTDNIPD